MKIVHICLACFYVEGMGYQENILPQYHAMMGHVVSVLTSDYAFNSKYEATKKNTREYVNEHNIHVRVLEAAKGKIGSRLRKYIGLYAELDAIKPDVIFVHGGQFVSLKDVVFYCKRHSSVRLYIDQHGDYYNTPVDTPKRKFIQTVVFGFWMRKAAKNTQKFWGVTPWRCEYLRDVYKLPKDKIDLLVMGGDDRYIHFDQMPKLRSDIRNKLNIEEDDFVLITGGKIDKPKNIHLLMQAVDELHEPKIKLIVFGQPNNEMESIIASYAEKDCIQNLGWIDSKCVYDYFLASDLAVFPGTHSVLWEQSCACGLPGLFKDWKGMHHVEVNGSAEFLYDDSVEEMKRKILELYQNKEKYNMMKNAAQLYGVKAFSYADIARRAIGLE